MKCAVHPEADATNFCRNCGKPMCPECVRDVKGVFYCEPCLAAMVEKSHPAARPRREARHPWAAFGLGWIPGLGAVYNGEYTKALIFVAIFIGLVTLDSTGARQPFYGLMTGFFCLYMPIEAFISARRNLENGGQEDTGLPAAAVRSPGAPGSADAAPAGEGPRHFPMNAVIMIAIGGIFLLDTLGWMDVGRALDVGWPLILIAVGGYLLWKRTRRTN